MKSGLFAPIVHLPRVEREDLTPTTLGLTLAESKALLKALQEVIVQQQLTAYLETQRPCTHCGHVQRSKGYHTTQVRTVFGTISVQSPRLHQCSCQPQPAKTFSPLAALLHEHVTPELLFLETKWAALVSYGVTAELLHEVLPIDDALAPCTIREHVVKVAERLEQALGEESGRLSTAVRPSGATCRSPTGRSPWASMGATSAPHRSEGGSR